jgi:hypothetical protein
MTPVDTIILAYLGYTVGLILCIFSNDCRTRHNNDLSFVEYEVLKVIYNRVTELADKLEFLIEYFSNWASIWFMFILTVLILVVYVGSVW